MKNLLKKEWSFFYFTLVLLFYSNIYAQEWAPRGAEWYYNNNLSGGGQIFYNYIRMYTEKDTMINEIICKKIITDGTQKSFFIYDSLRRVYYFDKYSNNFKLLYDFNKSQGESWEIFMYDSENSIYDTLTIKVDSVSSVLINNTYLAKIMYCEESSLGNKLFSFVEPIFIEYIGNIRTFLPQYYLCDPFPGPIRCYNDSVFGEYNTLFIKPLWWNEIANGNWASIPECDYNGFMNITNYSKDNLFSIFPNPSNNIITIESIGNYKILDIVDITGKSIMKKVKFISKDELSVSGINKGEYYIIIKNTENVFYIKFIVL